MPIRKSTIKNTDVKSEPDPVEVIDQPVTSAEPESEVSLPQVPAPEGVGGAYYINGDGVRVKA